MVMGPLGKAWAIPAARVQAAIRGLRKRNIGVSNQFWGPQQQGGSISFEVECFGNLGYKWQPLAPHGQQMCCRRRISGSMPMPCSFSAVGTLLQIRLPCAPAPGRWARAGRRCQHAVPHVGGIVATARLGKTWAHWAPTRSAEYAPTASARSLPLWICGSTEPSVANELSSWPPIRSVTTRCQRLCRARGSAAAPGGGQRSRWRNGLSCPPPPCLRSPGRAQHGPWLGSQPGASLAGWGHHQRRGCQPPWTEGGRTSPHCKMVPTRPWYSAGIMVWLVAPNSSV